MAISIGLAGLTSVLAGYSAAASPASALSRSDPAPGSRTAAPSAEVDISEAARSKLAAEQAAENTVRSDNLPVGTKHFLERLVDDPEYCAEYAEGYVNNVHAACMTIQEALQGRRTLEAGIGQLRADWSAIQGKGGSPAENFAQLLKRELSMPQSYWDAMDPGHTTPDIRALTQAKLDYLQQYIAAAKTA